MRGSLPKPHADLLQFQLLAGGGGMAMLQLAVQAARGRSRDAKRIRRALARAGRGQVLGLHLVPGLVIADVLEHGGGPTMLPGTAVALVWGGDAQIALDVVSEHCPAGVLAVVAWRPAGLWQRMRAWWRERTYRP